MTSIRSHILRAISRLLYPTRPAVDEFIPPAGLYMGTGCRVLGKPCIHTKYNAEIHCGNEVVLNSNREGYHAGMAFPVTLLADRPEARITIGDASRLHGCCIHAWSQITLGRKCLVAAGAQILDAHGHATELEYARLRTQIQDAPEPIIIGDFCWIGLGALILKGTRLGEGCIVGARSVVAAGDYPPFSLLVGIPARVVRTIDPDQVLPEDADIAAYAINGKRMDRY